MSEENKQDQLAEALPEEVEGDERPVAERSFEAKGEPEGEAAETDQVELPQYDEFNPANEALPAAEIVLAVELEAIEAIETIELDEVASLDAPESMSRVEEEEIIAMRDEIEPPIEALTAAEIVLAAELGVIESSGSINFDGAAAPESAGQAEEEEIASTREETEPALEALTAEEIELAAEMAARESTDSIKSAEAAADGVPEEEKTAPQDEIKPASEALTAEEIELAAELAAIEAIESAEAVAAPESLGQTEEEITAARDEIKPAIEALLFVAEEPLQFKNLCKLLGDVSEDDVRAAIEELVADYEARASGLEVREIGGGWRISTRPQSHDFIRKYLKSRPSARLSLPALETLAVIAYKQPITIPEILEIRGVTSSSAIKTLLEKRLIVTKGRKETVGRPMMYGTSKEFLIQFGLRDLTELPSIEDFEDLAQ
jgi:segregation and condensation protein B